MSPDHSETVAEFMDYVEQKNRHEPEFLQAVREVVESVIVVLDKRPELRKARVLERMVEPERIIQFRVPWIDDDEDVQVNRGYRVEFSSAIGPYKGGLRFHPSVNQSILKFLGFEQIFKNALTTEPIGGGKGGSDFNPKGKSDAEVMRFCQSFMTELARHIGEHTDIPAGDIGVGLREIGYLFGQYKRMTNQFTGVITGKHVYWGGSHLRPEATGYGVAYFAASILTDRNDTLNGKTCLVSGAGNVAQYAVEKINALGGKVITLSDSGGAIVDEAGIDKDKLAWVMELKNKRRGRIEEYTEKFDSAEFIPRDRDADHNPLWDVKADCAFPCATENELNARDAENLAKNGVTLLCEGANMPLTADAIDVVAESDMIYGPGKAANAGGVAVSALEMAQNSMRLTWPRDRVERRLREIMQSIHDECVNSAEQFKMKKLPYLHGANIAGFCKVADAMLDQGVV